MGWCGLLFLSCRVRVKGTPRGTEEENKGQVCCMLLCSEAVSDGR
jgi:hypothetical protein